MPKIVNLDVIAQPPGPAAGRVMKRSFLAAPQHARVWAAQLEIVNHGEEACCGRRDDSMDIHRLNDTLVSLIWRDILGQRQPRGSFFPKVSHGRRPFPFYSLEHMCIHQRGMHAPQLFHTMKDCAPNATNRQEFSEYESILDYHVDHVHFTPHQGALIKFGIKI